MNNGYLKDKAMEITRRERKKKKYIYKGNQKNSINTSLISYFLSL